MRPEPMSPSQNALLHRARDATGSGDHCGGSGTDALDLSAALERLARDHGPAVEARVTAVVTVDGDFLLERYEIEVRVRPHHSWQVFLVVYDPRAARAVVRAFAQRQSLRRQNRERPASF